MNSPVCQSYGPGLLAGSTFFMLAALASVSCVVSVLAGAYGSVGVGAYVDVRNLAMHQARLRGEARPPGASLFLRSRLHVD